MSFGMQNRFTLGGKASPTEKDANGGYDRDPMNGSMISIKDIQEVRDRQPASPSTIPQKQAKETYFQ